jgi:hypothetical protein
MNRPAIIALAIAACAFASHVRAVTLGVHTVSAHEMGGYRIVTPGAYVRGQSGIGAGVLRNSIGRASWHADYTLQTAPGPVRLAVTVGGITGYPHAAVSPVLTPSVLLAERVRLLYLPAKPDEPKSSQALHLAIEF